MSSAFPAEPFTQSAIILRLVIGALVCEAKSRTGGLCVKHVCSGTMTAQEALQISQEEQMELQHLSDLLHLFHHRNKNQHRRSIWWRHFSVFRKQLASLVSDISELNEVPTTNLAKTKKKSQDARILATHSQRMAFWRDIMVPKWQHSFSQVVADGRFSVLGLVLMAVLAQICRIVGLTAELEDLGQIEVEKVLEDFGREQRALQDSVGDPSQGEDVGEVIRREEEEDDDDDMLAQMPASAEPKVKPAIPPTPEAASKATTKRPSETSEKRSKKKRRKGNAIDDIFG